jgi:hypothetical protein
VDSIHLPNAIALPNAFGAPGTPLPPGQIVQALVLELIESGVFRLQLPQAVVDVRSSVALTPGSTVTLAVKSGGANATLVIYSDAPPAVQAGQRAASNLGGRQPIGEAVIIARVPTQAAASPTRRISAEPAVLRDAPPLDPARVLPRQAEVSARTVTPEQAVGEAVRVAAPRQAGLAPLFADAEQAVEANALPARVRAAATDLLSLRLPLDAQLTGPDVKQAFIRSGVLFEGRVASTTDLAQATRSIAAPSPQNAAPAPADDLKAALLVFRQLLKTWAAREPAIRTAPPTPSNAAADVAAPPAASTTIAAIKVLANALAAPSDQRLAAGTPLSPEQATTLAKTVASALSSRETPSPQPAATAAGGPPPPYRGAPLAAQAPAVASIAPDASPREIADRLIAQTDGALARQTLLQVASLPGQPDVPRADAAQRWSFEIPFATPQGTSIAQFEVSRDGRAPRSDPQTRTWRARFSLDVEPMGPVHALIALAGARTSVTLWAERAATAARLQETAPLLNDALRAAELEPADLQLRVGAPPALRQAAPGRFMDRAS